MKSIEFIVLTCDKYLDTRVKAVRETWGKNTNIKFLTDSKSELNDVIGFDTQKNYAGIFEKYFNLFLSYDFDKYDYYFFTDDDTFVVHKNLEKLELPSPDSLFCVCRELCLNSDGTDRWGNQTGTNVSIIRGDRATLPLYYPSGGSGFILSKGTCNAIKKYLKDCKDVPWAWFSDLSIGFWMRNCGVEIIKNENFWWETHEKLLTNTWEKYNSDENVITFHYVNENTMRAYKEKYS